MILFHHISLDHYCNSPLTFIHKIKPHVKIYFIFITLILLPYFNVVNLNIFYLLILILIGILLIIYIYIFKTLTILKYIFSYIFYHILFNQIIKYDNYIITSKIFLPYYGKFLSLEYKKSKTNTNYQIIIYYFVYLIPKYIEKVFIINISSFILIYFLFVFTQYELVINNLIFIFTNIYKFRYKKFITINLISYQYLEKITEHTKNIYLSILIKNNYLKNKRTIYITHFIYQFYLRLLEDQNNISTIIWVRNFSNIILNKLISI
uniref:Uncharacterized protein n=1 Tax=Ophidocladus simpliciusculus TaxID=1261574 RepID=A0A1Z1MJP1_9FLOR|nr:hypothetical protein [Ophidocladus simpliciusculus]ARW65981.1 hypothetical protein [Ophidocladus simpliciusculus]